MTSAREKSEPCASGNAPARAARRLPRVIGRVPLSQTACSPFTLIELLTVIAIIAILASMLQTSLFQSKERAKFIRWTVYSNNLRSDPSLIGQWTFTPEDMGGGGEGYDAVAPNKAFGLSSDGYKKKNLDAYLGGVERLRKGRWMGKGSVYFPGRRGSFAQADDKGPEFPKKSIFFYNYTAF